MSVQVRTTITPGVISTVTAREYDDLDRLGLLYHNSPKLVVNWLSYSDGPAEEVQDVTIQIQGPSPSTSSVVAETDDGVEHIGIGAYAYRWGNASTAAGSYTVTWRAVDVDSVAVTATETVVIP